MSRQVHSSKLLIGSILESCKEEDEGRLRRSLEKDANHINIIDQNGRTLLHYCAEHSAPIIADYLLNRKPQLLVLQDDDGYTTLHLTAICGNGVMMVFLIKKAKELLNGDSYLDFLDCCDNENHTAFHWSTVCGELECLTILHEAGASASVPDIHGAQPIHYAAQSCNFGRSRETGLRVLKELLRLCPGAKDSCDRDGRSPLLWAASSDNNDAILTLVNYKADVSLQDKDGLNALHCAASRGYVECLETLISFCGAETDQMDSNGCSPMFYAVTLGHADCTQFLLQNGAEANRQDIKGRTAAHCGAAKGQLETLKILAQHGANLWIRNIRGDVPLHEAVRSGRKELVRWLLEQSPSSVSIGNTFGRTPLHVACMSNNVEMCKVLMDMGSDVNALMKSKGQQLTPLDSALHRGHRSCAKFLLLHGALPAAKLGSSSANVQRFANSKSPCAEDDVVMNNDHGLSVQSRQQQANSVSLSIQTESSRSAMVHDVRIPSSMSHASRMGRTSVQHVQVVNQVSESPYTYITTTTAEPDLKSQSIVTNVYVTTSGGRRRTLKKIKRTKVPKARNVKQETEVERSAKILEIQNADANGVSANFVDPADEANLVHSNRTVVTDFNGELDANADKTQIESVETVNHIHEAEPLIDTQARESEAGQGIIMVQHVHESVTESNVEPSSKDTIDREQKEKEMEKEKPEVDHDSSMIEGKQEIRELIDEPVEVTNKDKMTKSDSTEIRNEVAFNSNENADDNLNSHADSIAQFEADENGSVISTIVGIEFRDQNNNLGLIDTSYQRVHAGDDYVDYEISEREDFADFEIRDKVDGYVDETRDVKAEDHEDKDEPSQAGKLLSIKDNIEQINEESINIRRRREILDREGPDESRKEPDQPETETANVNENPSSSRDEVDAIAGVTEKVNIESPEKAPEDSISNLVNAETEPEMSTENVAEKPLPNQDDLDAINETVTVNIDSATKARSSFDELQLEQDEVKPETESVTNENAERKEEKTAPNELLVQAQVHTLAVDGIDIHGEPETLNQSADNPEVKRELVRTQSVEKQSQGHEVVLGHEVDETALAMDTPMATLDIQQREDIRTDTTLANVPEILDEISDERSASHDPENLMTAGHEEKEKRDSIKNPERRESQDEHINDQVSEAETGHELPSLGSENSLQGSVSVMGDDDMMDGLDKDGVDKVLAGQVRAATTFEFRTADHEQLSSAEEFTSTGSRKVKTRADSRCNHKLHLKRTVHGIGPIDVSHVTAKVDTRSMAANRRYKSERKLFEELQELKRCQIRSNRSHETLLVKRLADKFDREVRVPGMSRFAGPYNYKMYERFLYDNLRKLSQSNHGKLIRSTSEENMASGASEFLNIELHRHGSRSVANISSNFTQLHLESKEVKLNQGDTLNSDLDSVNIKPVKNSPYNLKPFPVSLHGRKNSSASSGSSGSKIPILKRKPSLTKVKQSTKSVPRQRRRWQKPCCQNIEPVQPLDAAVNRPLFKRTKMTIPPKLQYRVDGETISKRWEEIRQQEKEKQLEEELEDMKEPSLRKTTSSPQLNYCTLLYEINLRAKEQLLSKSFSAFEPRTQRHACLHRTLSDSVLASVE
ncbi:Inversin [Halotydeus destructor]|nr:Inversin [Halotydeus destructor]